MTMRISSAAAFDSSLRNLQQRQIGLADAQERLTLGKRVIKASDDPTAAARAERSLATINRTEANLRALDASRSVMQQTEVALGDAGDLMQQVREFMVSAGNASYSDDERRVVATALRGLRTQLLSVSNRGDGAGGYLFGGQGSTNPPFVDGPLGVTFAGTPGFLRAATDEPLPMSLDGRNAWLAAPNPIPGGPDVSVFAVLDETIALLETPNQTSTDIVNALHTHMQNFDSSMTHMLSYRSRAGESLHRADSMEERLDQVKLVAQTERSTAEDLDMVESISRFQAQQTGYDAALKTYSMVQRMTLFDYIGR